MTTPDLSKYRILIADWAIPPDAIAIEHLPNGDTPPFCLLYATTLPLDIHNLVEGITRHDAECTALHI